LDGDGELSELSELYELSGSLSFLLLPVLLVPPVEEGDPGVSGGDGRGDVVVVEGAGDADEEDDGVPGSTSSNVVYEIPLVGQRTAFGETRYVPTTAGSLVLSMVASMVLQMVASKVLPMELQIEGSKELPMVGSMVASLVLSLSPEFR